MKNDLMQTIKDIDDDDNLTDSQKARLTDPQAHLIGFLNSHLNEASAKNELKEEIEKGLLDDLRDGVLSVSVKLKVYEILTNKETTTQASTLNVIAKMLEVKANKSTSGLSDSGHKTRPDSGITQQEMLDGREAIKLINELKKSEGIDEFFKKKENKE